MLLYDINNNYAKKRGIGKKIILTLRAVMLEEHVDVVAGDFNGAAWRRDNSKTISIMEEAFADRALPMSPSPHHCGVYGRFRVRGQTCVDLSSPWIQMNGGEYGNTAPFQFTMQLLAADRSEHHEVWLHLVFVEQRNGQAHHERHEERRLLLKERSSGPYHYNKVPNSQRICCMSVSAHACPLHATRSKNVCHQKMNSMSDVGDFQDVESNYSGRLSHASGQLAMIPSARSMLHAEPRQKIVS